MTYLRGFIVWIAIVLAETLHGIARTLLLAPYIGDFEARQVAVFTGAAIIQVIAFLSVRWLRAASVGNLLGIGFLWLGLTIAFEIVLGRFILNYPWERIAADYNLLEGGLLPIGLVVLTLAPLIAAKVRGIRAADIVEVVYTSKTQ